MTCTWIGYDADDRPVRCRSTATHWSTCRGDASGEGVICAEHRCDRCGGVPLEEHKKRTAATPLHWMAL